MSTTEESSLISTTTSIDKLPSIVDSIRQDLKYHHTQVLWRKEQIQQIKKCLLEKRHAVISPFSELQFELALKKDLKQIDLIIKFEYSHAVDECDYMLDHLDEFVKPKPCKTPLILFPSQASYLYEPYGIVLIISPWNYPMHLSLVPLIGAIAAGNTVVLKPSEVSSASAQWLATYLPQYLDPKYCRIVLGGPTETQILLQQRWDYIFYTGNASVGRLVLNSAARHLTPVTLELGGRNPVIFDETATLSIGLRRLLWGKFSNNGQTCISPNHVYVKKSVLKDFIRLAKEIVKEFYTENPQTSKLRWDLFFYHALNGNMISRHFERLNDALSPCLANVIHGGTSDESDLYFPPTLLLDPPLDTPLMKEEIFGPILPILVYTDLDDLLGELKKQDAPLVFYLFSRCDKTIKKVQSNTRSGAFCVNEVLSHASCRDLPFGGVGASGYGQYSGKYSLETFSQRRSILKRPLWTDPGLRFPPYTPRKLRWFYRLLHFRMKAFKRPLYTICICIVALIIVQLVWGGLGSFHWGNMIPSRKISI